jgi:hypothetical protein
MNDIVSGYIYLIKEEEFGQLNENIYKLGKTRQKFNEFQTNAEIILFREVYNCDYMETLLLKLFKQKFIQKEEYGQEYFEGDKDRMSIEINKECTMALLKRSDRESIKNQTHKPTKTNNNNKEPKMTVQPKNICNEKPKKEIIQYKNKKPSQIDNQKQKIIQSDDNKREITQHKNENNESSEINIKKHQITQIDPKKQIKQKEIMLSKSAEIISNSRQNPSIIEKKDTFKCAICGHIYKYEGSYRKHLEKHPEVSEMMNIEDNDCQSYFECEFCHRK